MGLVFKSRYRGGQAWVSRASTYGTKSGPDREGTIPGEIQRIATEGHPGFRHLDGNRDVGGVFESWKLSIPTAGTPHVSNWNFQKSLGGWQYHTDTYLVAHTDVLQAQAAVQNGTLSSDTLIASWLTPRVPTGPNTFTMNGMGTKAIDMVKPTNPSVDLATGLAELWAERKFFSVPGKGGSVPGEYLNYQFGIAPTLGMFQDLRSTIERQDEILRQYIRDSKKVVRRKFRFRPEVTVTRSTSTSPVISMGWPLSGHQAPPGGILTRVTTTTQQYWFAGAFRYSIPEGAFPKRIAELDRLYGVVPGISTGWELIPFSWLVDYFTPIGSLVSNMESFLADGLVLPYAYLMSSTTVKDEYNWQGPLANEGGTLANSFGVYSCIERRRDRRVHATPFGFGLLGSDLSPKQLSIIAALGLTLRK